MANIAVIAAVFSISLAVFGVIAAKLFLRAKKSFDAAGGIEGLQQMVHQAQSDHPARAFPVVTPAGQVKASRILVIIFLFTAVLSCGVGSYIQVRMLREAWLLESEGVVTMATVAQKRIVEDDEDGDTYYVDYTFVATSEIGRAEGVRREERVSYQLFSRVPEEGRVEVIYARSDPEIARMTAHYEPGKVSYVPIIVGGIVALTDALLLFWFYKRYVNASRLEIEGVPGTVTILDLHESSDSDSTTYYVAYALPDGQQIRHSVSRKIYETLKVGDVVRIIYLPDDLTVFRPEWESVA